MSATRITRLAKRWVAEQRAWVEGERDVPGIQAVMDLGYEQPEVLWEFIVEVTKLNGDPDTLENLGAGPLEDLIRDYGHDFLGRIETESVTNPRLRKALSHVWITASEDRRYVQLGCILLPPRET
jgi:hypothetical protein